MEIDTTFIALELTFTVAGIVIGYVSTLSKIKRKGIKTPKGDYSFTPKEPQNAPK